MNQWQIIYILAWLLFSFLAVIGATQLFATIFNSSAGQMLGQGIAFLTLLVTGTLAILNHTGSDRDEEQAEDSPGPDIEPESEADTESANPGNQSSLRRSNDTILTHAEQMLNDHLTIYDDGTIEREGQEFSLYKEMLLYVVGKRLAYEDAAVDTPAVTVDELRSQLDCNAIEILLFFDEAQNWLTLANDQTTAVADLDYTDLDAAAVTVKTRTVDDAIEWILDPTIPDDIEMVANVGNAAMALHNAREHYEAGKDYEANGDTDAAADQYDAARNQIETACGNIKHYPILIEHDTAWTEFTQNTETLLEDGVPDKLERCLPKMNRHLATIQEKADNRYAVLADK